MVTDTELTAKIAAANVLLAKQEAGLVRAIELLRADRIGRHRVPYAQSLLNKVRHFQRDMARAPEHFAGQTLGFMGNNGSAATIRDVCGDAERLAS